MADVNLTAEKDRQDADALFHFVHFEPVDGLVDRQMSQTWQQIIVTLIPVGRRSKPVGAREDFTDAILAMIQRSLYACAEAAVTLKQVVEDQSGIMLGFRRKLNFQSRVRGASRRSYAR